MAWLYQTDGQHQSNLLFKFGFLKMGITVWFNVDWVHVRDEMNMVLNVTGGGKLVWFVVNFWELVDDGSHLGRCW